MKFSENDWNNNYIQVINSFLTDEYKYSTFKIDPVYNEILEHVSYEQGQLFLNEIQKDSPSFYKHYSIFNKNDLIGSPRKFIYDDPIGETSPTTIRYVKVASDIKKYFGKNIGKNIAEIGVGYGGQCLIMDTIYEYDTYNLFDLCSVLKLTQKYLESFVLKNSYKLNTLNQTNENNVYDLVISNYAFSELPKSLQLIYVNKIIKNSKRGYMTMNSGMYNCENRMTPDDLREFIPNLTIRDEIPNTHPWNYIITWDNSDK